MSGILVPRKVSNVKWRQRANVNDPLKFNGQVRKYNNIVDVAQYRMQPPSLVQEIQ